MRRSASEIIRNLEVRIAKLERQSRTKRSARSLAEQGEWIDNYLPSYEADHVLETINTIENRGRVSRKDKEEAQKYMNGLLDLADLRGKEADLFDDMMELLRG